MIPKALTITTAHLVNYREARFMAESKSNIHIKLDSVVRYDEWSKIEDDIPF